ncbi:MAG: tail fiber domain-containing protein [Verrucomicrobiota bacterium]
MKKCVLILLPLVLLTITPSLPAQGTAFTYQGQLQNNGSPADGHYDFTFALFDNSSTNTGQQVGVTKTNLDVGVTNGLFTVTLEFGENFPGASRWLAIGVRTNGGGTFTPLAPLQPLTPTPYAIYSPNAGAAASANSVAGSNVVGSIPVGGLPAIVLTNGASGVNISGAFSGNVTATSLQMAPLTVVSSTNYATNGTYTFTVPPSVTGMVVKLWGAGGGGGDFTSGGGGAFSQVSLNVTPGDTYVVVVGQGGGTYAGNDAGGGAGSNDGSGGAGNNLAGGGGQASSLFHYTGSAYIMQAVAGGGSGGSDIIAGAGGQASGSGAGYAADATTTGVTNLDLVGGDGQSPPNQATGGGGGGYGGGASQGYPGNFVFGGGSYGDVTLGGGNVTPGNTADTNYLAGSGIGGSTTPTSGGDGLAVVLFGTGGGLGVTTLTVGGRIGIGTSDPQQKLDVNGNINASGAVTAASISGNVAAASLQIAPLTVVSSTTYAANGIYAFTVPPSVTSMVVKLWGAGGGGGDYTSGGGGAFSLVSLNVTPGDTYVVVVGQGGGTYSNNVSGGGAGANDGSGGAGFISGTAYAGTGGQASSLFLYNGLAYIMQAVAGGGGAGSDSWEATGGQAGGSGSGYAANATTTGVTNLDLVGGDGQAADFIDTGGCGGGYGGGILYGETSQGGGSYGNFTIGGSVVSPGNTADSNYLAGSGIGGGSGGINATAGSDGLAVVLFGTGGVNGNLNANGAVTAATFSGDGGGLTDLNAANLTGALPAISGANLTSLTAANLLGPLPAISGANLTDLNAAKLTGPLPAISGANLTALPTNAALLSSNQTFTGLNTFSAVAVFNGGISNNNANGYEQSSLGAFNIDASGLTGGRMTVTTGGLVGIGTNNPSTRLNVVGTGVTDDGKLLIQTTGGSFGPQLRLNKGGTGGQEWVFVANGTANGAVGALQIVESGLGTRLMIATNGDVGIGTTSPDSLLTVDGTADKPGGGSWNTFSDARLKDVGAAFTHGMEALAALQPVHYHYKPENPLNLPSQPDYIGVVAQQVQGVIPEAVQKNQDGYLTVNNDPIIWTMVNAIKELNQKHEAEEKEKDAEIAALKSKADKVDALQNRLDELETTVRALAEKK